MSGKTIELEFNGFYSSPEKMIRQSGVYCVYTGIKSIDGVKLLELIYIGESSNVGKRYEDGHEKYDDFLSYLESGQSLWFSCAPVNSTDRKRAECALIYEHRPEENLKSFHSFNFPETTIKVTGKTRYLNTEFTIEP